MKLAILLIKDKNLREEMGIKGKDRFCNNYTLQHFEYNMKDVFDTILKTGGIANNFSLCLSYYQFIKES